MGDSFPDLNKKKYENLLSEQIAKKEAWVYRYEDKIVAALLYSKENSKIEFLAVSPDYRRQGLGTRLVETAAAGLQVGAKLFVTTHSEKETSGEDARLFYKSLGFTPEEELLITDSPYQRLCLIVPDGSISVAGKCR